MIFKPVAVKQTTSNMRLSSALVRVGFKTSNEHHTRHADGDKYNSSLSHG